MSSNKISTVQKFEEMLGTKAVWIVLGGAVFFGLIIFLVALSIPQERRACALMPGFCAPKKEAPKASGKFGSIAPPAGAAPFSLNQ